MRRLHNVFIRNTLIDRRADLEAIARILKQFEGELAADASVHVGRAQTFAAAAAAEIQMALQERLMPRVIEHAPPPESAAA